MLQTFKLNIEKQKTSKTNLVQLSQGIFTKRVIRPGTISGGTRKLIHETMTNIPDGK